MKKFWVGLVLAGVMACGTATKVSSALAKTAQQSSLRQDPLVTFDDLPPSFQRNYYTDRERIYFGPQGRLDVWLEHPQDDWFALPYNGEFGSAISATSLKVENGAIEFWYLRIDAQWLNHTSNLNPTLGLFKYRLSCRNNTIAKIREVGFADFDHPLYRDNTRSPDRPISGPVVTQWRDLLCGPRIESIKVFKDHTALVSDYTDWLIEHRRAAR